MTRATHNTIEVLYSFNGYPPRPFEQSLPIPGVNVSSPTVSLSPKYERTALRKLPLNGVVTPYFEGLSMTVETLGRGTSRVVLEKFGRGNSAGFTHEVDLLPDISNTIFFKFHYEKDPLPQSDDRIVVYCDTEPPGLREPVEFEVVQEWLNVTILPNEPLRQLRIKESSHGEGMGAFVVVEPLQGTKSYRHNIALPVRLTEFQIELVDRAGHESLVHAVWGEHLDVALAHGRGGPAGALRGDGPRVGVVHASEFVRRVGLEFRPFGFSPDRLEMSHTEVTELAWTEFLRGRGRNDVAAGSARLPMTLDQEPPELIYEFVRWFERNADDGFTYFIPSVVEWKQAFSGANDPAQANAEIAKWFSGGREDNRQFDSSPKERYGYNRVSNVGSRRENATPTGFLDMESNVQEIVLDGDLFYVIGGDNSDTSADRMTEACLRPRLYSQREAAMGGALTGLRLCRKLPERE